MDVVGWLILAAVIATAGVFTALAPRWKRDNLRRQLDGGGGSLGGIGAGFDAVWRPSVEDAHAQWEASVQLPAPAPTPGDKGLDEGPLVIDVSRHPER